MCDEAQKSKLSKKVLRCLLCQSTSHKKNGWENSLLQLVCQGCHSKSPQTQNLKTTEIYSFTAWEIRSPKSVLLSQNQCPQGHPHSLWKLQERIYSLPPQAHGGCWHSLTRSHIDLCLCGHNSSSSVYIKSPSASLLQRYLQLELGAIWTIQDNLLISRSLV